MMKSSQKQFTIKDQKEKLEDFLGQLKFNTTKFRFFVLNLWVSRYIIIKSVDFHSIE